MLLFKKKFLSAIRSGEKTQTIRVWKRRCMKSGQKSYIPGVGHIWIDLVEPVQVEALTDEDAIPDGFESAQSLRQELQSIYGDKLNNGACAYRIRFHITQLK